MAAPRIFVSSTCYDLQDVRNNIRSFIQEYGYEPVMSEFGDIFYDYKLHIQDACISEIGKCQLFLLVIGNNYGSFYHKNKSHYEIPDSVTLREFRKSLSDDIPKHIFINRFVEYDYKNYRKALEKALTKEFTKDIDDNDTEKVKLETRKKFDAIYHFPSENYKYLFHFLDMIYELKINNAIYPFEVSEEIKTHLKKQWASMMHSTLTAPREVVMHDGIAAKIDNLEKLLQQVLSTKTESGGAISFDINKISNAMLTTELENAQTIVDDTINTMMYAYNGKYHSFAKIITKPRAKKWLSDLSEIVRKYKWSKTIPFSVLFQGFGYRYFSDYENVPFADILKFFSLYNSLSEEEKDSFVDTIEMKLNTYYKSDEPEFDPDDDIPF